MKIYNENSIVNLSNSLLKNFGVPTFHDTIPEIDGLLNGHKKVVLLLFDGMGQNIVRKHLKESSFIRTHYVHTVNSTMPPTTAAATTAILSARYPIETGWLAWMQYFPQLDRNMILFRGIDFNTGEKIEENGRAIMPRFYPYESILELVNKQNRKEIGLNISEYPINPDGHKNLRQGAKKLHKALKDADERLIYFYYGEPDYHMHECGIDSWKVHFEVRRIDRFVKKVVKQNPDTVFLTVADHGHINVKYQDICNHPDLFECFSRKMALEKRMPSFFVKEDKKEQFEKLFNQYYGEHFELITKEEALNIKLFGEGIPAPEIDKCFGNYIAISKDEYSVYASKELKRIDLFKGHHAGGTDEERLIDISAFNN